MKRAILVTFFLFTREGCHSRKLFSSDIVSDAVYSYKIFNTRHGKFQILFEQQIRSVHSRHEGSEISVLQKRSSLPRAFKIVTFEETVSLMLTQEGVIIHF